MKILLLGANGQLGTDIQNVIASSKSDSLELIAFTRNELDVCNIESIPRVLEKLKFNVLINCTSYHKTDEVEDNAGKAVLINSHAVQKMAQVCQDKNAKLFHISTDYVFSGNKLTPYIESDCPAPINVYGVTKYFGETLAQQECELTYILRVASLFGVAGASGKGGNFVETMIRLGKEKGEIRVVDDIKMSPTSTESVAQIILSVIKNEVEPGIYHAVNSGEATWYEFAKKIITITGIDANVIPITSQEYPTRAMRPKYSVLANTLLNKKIDHNILHWKEALNRYMKIKKYI